MSVTIKDIAKELNLSRTTISFVLTGVGTEKGVSKKTQERVLAYVESINYQPNLLARSLIKGVSSTIGVIVPSIGDSFYAKLVKEIEKEAEKKGYVIIISSSERIPEHEIKLIRTMRAKQVDGLVIAPTEHLCKEMDKLLNDKFPFVLVDRFFPDLDTNYVIVNDMNTSYRLVRNLIEKGRKRIAFITTNTKVSALDDRLAGYKNALNSAGIPFDSAIYCEVPRDDYSEHIGDILEKLFYENPDVDALFFTTHYLASDAVMYMFRKGMDIASYGLATVHTNPILEVLSPKMSPARIPLDVIGRNVIDILIEDIKAEGKAPKTGSIISTEIIIND
jgi:LacI family transcriptional regulator